MRKICSVDNCSNDVFENTTECVLHCEKSDYSHDFNNKGILKRFYDALIDYVAGSIFKFGNSFISSEIRSNTVKDYLNGEEFDDGVVDFCNKQVIVFNAIFFPCRDNRDPFDYLNILRKVKGVHFNYCKFTANSIEIPEVEAFFQDCEFYRWWSITQSKILENINNVLYQDCNFRENVSSYLGDDQNALLDISLFNDCSFEKELSFGNVSLNKPVFNNTDGTTVKINRLRIENCRVEGKFVLNNSRVNHILIKDSEFKWKVELKYGHIDDIELINTNFKGLFDSFSTRYGKFYCFKNIFSDFVGFEKCKFAALEGDSELNQLSVFKFVTFIGFTNFRNSKFYQGLDLEDTNLKEAPNFLNIELLSGNTNRETLRIIKNSFDKIGNHIEANKFFVLEMSKYKQELSKKPLNQEKLIFWLNEKTSNFGQSYLLPIFWVVIFSIIYYLIILGYESNLLYRLMPYANEKIKLVSSVFNGVAASIIPFKSLLRDGMEFISLLFYIIFASLIWQIIVAVKRHTRR
ncbi:hypothetical protein [Citrobacter sp. FDAARGOS_156]|uniref:hypothetical protein n=1 Tax=Citrobacter sp. FDAARGOS_156 TaxID=1702170 RepID=UPI00190295A2|nr:hypothetical protein [Citrobacter sp. FDAARGOS_156]MBJ9559766.1 hypothetical protein [Citrobacter sp. FDAARGOS_156]